MTANTTLPPPKSSAKSAAKAPTPGRKAKPKRAPAPPKPPLMRRLRERAAAFRLRLLPVTIFVLVLMLGVRVGDLWQVMARNPTLPEFPVSQAQMPAGRPAFTPSAQPSNIHPAASGTETPAAAGDPAAAQPASPGPDDPLGPVDNTELLQHYAARRAELERRTQDISQREALLAAAEKRIDEKVAELHKVRDEIQKLLRLGDERQGQQLDSLVKIYETMKPKEAARIFEELELPVLLDVVQQMKETKTAPILAAMDPRKAKEVTSALVERKLLPSVPQ